MKDSINVIKDNIKRIKDMTNIFWKSNDDFFLFVEKKEFVFEFEDNILFDNSSVDLSSIFIIFYKYKFN